MEKTIRYCDCHGKAMPGTERFHVATGEQRDSNGTETITTEVDLCPATQAELVRAFIKRPAQGSHEYEWGKQFVATYKKVRG